MKNGNASAIFMKHGKLANSSNCCGFSNPPLGRAGSNAGNRILFLICSIACGTINKTWNGGQEMTRECVLRRHALQIVARLPENPTEARRALDYARELLDTLDDGLRERTGLILVSSRTDATACRSLSRTGKLSDPQSSK